MRISLHEVRRLICEALLNAYDVLGLRPGASEDDIKAAWKKLALQNHPDRGGKHGAMVDINNAKDQLLNPLRKARGAMFKGYEDPNAPAPANPFSAPKPKTNEPYHAPGRNDKRDSRQDADDRERADDRSSKNPQPGSRKFRYFENTEEGEFWEISFRLGQTAYTVGWGRIGSPGQSLTKSFGSASTAYAGAAQAIMDKKDRGYVQKDRPASRDNSAPPADDRERADDRSSKNPQPGGRKFRYFENTEGEFGEFWEISFSPGETAYTLGWGRIGSPGQSWTKTFGSTQQCLWTADQEIMDKKDRGYVEKDRPASRDNSAPPADKQKSASDPADRARAPKTYKIYGPKKGQPVHTRYKGKAYIPGAPTRFFRNDQAEVSPGDHGRIRVKKPNSDHTQSWDPVEEIRKTIDNLVIEAITAIGER